MPGAVLLYGPEVVSDSPPPLAGIFGIGGVSLAPDEARFFREANPLGFILFARNCQAPDQVRALTDSLRDCLGRECPILIDQEGGRVQRLKPPHWPTYLPARHFGDLYAENAAAAAHDLIRQTEAIAADLAMLGINVNCAPVLDVLFPQTHDAIGDRAFSGDPLVVARLAAVVCQVYAANGIMPVIKHFPGLGRADLDTHKDLPAVNARRDQMAVTDFAPFRVLAAGPEAGALWGMIGHALYSDLDAGEAASCSPRIIADIVRGDIGFDGLLLSDDLGMDALGRYGDVAARAARTLRAGCDIALHCNGTLADMQATAAAIPKMTKAAVLRYNRSASRLKGISGHDDRRAAV